MGMGWSPVTQPSSCCGSACCHLYLENFDLAAGRVDMLDVVAALVGGERVHLDPEGHALLAAVLPGGELGADAVDLQGGGNSRCSWMYWGGEGSGARSSGYLDEDGGVLGRVPEELDGVEVQRV